MLRLALFYAAALSVGCIDRSKWIQPADRPVLERQGNQIREALERYRATHDVYPDSLSQTDLTAEQLQTRFGPWMYERAAPANTGRGVREPYRLFVGHYDHNHFELWWEWRNQAWYWNQ
jgi:hypothetical protein